MKRINIFLNVFLCCLFFSSVISALYSTNTDVFCSVIIDNSSNIQGTANLMLSHFTFCELMLKEGTYKENVTINIPKGKLLTIKGEGNVVIDQEREATSKLNISGDGTVNLDGITFKNGYSWRKLDFGSTSWDIYDGGGALSLSVISNITNCNFIDNKGDGGAISSIRDINITNCNFSNNVAGLTIYKHDSGNNIYTTYSPLHGGAIFSFSGNLNVIGCRFENNRADEKYMDPYDEKKEFKEGSGGAIYVSGKLNIMGSDFINNNARYGGAIQAFSNIDVHECNFVNNRADIDGDAIAGVGGNVTNTFWYGNVQPRSFYGRGVFIYWPVAPEPFRWNT
ncbi:MAG: hypothetical protein LBR15_02435 [Methanobrevibacter sp.]|jgi:hypothetical protein|nr:hypothetical protein [Candidatus Methanovirga australis]